MTVLDNMNKAKILDLVLKRELAMNKNTEIDIIKKQNELSKIKRDLLVDRLLNNEVNF